MNSHEIRVWGGKVMTKQGDEEKHEGNEGAFVLDVETLVWRREG